MTNPSKQKNIYSKSSENDDKNPTLKSFQPSFSQLALSNTSLLVDNT